MFIIRNSIGCGQCLRPKMLSDIFSFSLVEGMGYIEDKEYLSCYFYPIAPSHSPLALYYVGPQPLALA